MEKLDIHRHYHWSIDWDTAVYSVAVIVGMIALGIYAYFAALLPRFDKAMAKHDKALVEECARLRTRIRCLEVMMEERVKQIEVVPDSKMIDIALPVDPPRYGKLKVVAE